MPSQNELNLNHTFITTILSYDPSTGLFTRLLSGNGVRSGDIANGLDKKGYIRFRIGKNKFFAHRLAFFYTYQRWPVDQIDHINGIRHDNRIVNLREATRSQNGCNTKLSSTNKSGYRGVCWINGLSKWRVQVYLHKKLVYHKLFKNLSDAIDARKAAEQIYHGNFARK